MEQVYVEGIVLANIDCVFYVNRIVISCLQSIQYFLHHFNELLIFNKPLTVDKDYFTALSTFTKHAFGFTVMFD